MPDKFQLTQFYKFNGCFSGGASALLLIQYAKKLGLDLSTLKSVFVSADPIDLK